MFFLLLLLAPLFAPVSKGKVSSEVHDVAVTYVTTWPILTLPAYVHVNVTVQNEGTSFETFNLTVHADNLTVTSVTVADLAPGSNRTLTLKCNLFPFRATIFPPATRLVREPMIGNVTVWAEASVVAGEVGTANNVCTSGTVKIIWWIVDINGDGRINIIDVTLVSRALSWGSTWHELYDLGMDGKFDIRDLVPVCRFFGRTYFLPEGN